MRWSSYFISCASVFTKGIGSVLQASQKLRRVKEMCELEHTGIWGCTAHHISSISTCLFSLSLPSVFDLQESLQRGQERRKDDCGVKVTEPSLHLKEDTASNKKRNFSSLLVSCLSHFWGSSYRATHLSSADVRTWALTSCHVNTKNCVGFMGSPLLSLNSGPVPNRSN